MKQLIAASIIGGVIASSIVALMAQSPAIDTANVGHLAQLKCMATDVAPPGQWITANGDTISDTGDGGTLAGSQYQNLFEAIKTKGWTNAGTEVWGTDTVTLPDLRERFLIMADGTNYVHGSTTTKNITSVSVDALAETNIPQHNHEDPSFTGQTGNNDVNHDHSTDAHKDQGGGSSHGGGAIGQASATNGDNSVNHQHALTNFGQASPTAPTVNSGSATATMSRAVVTCFIRY